MMVDRTTNGSGTYGSDGYSKLLEGGSVFSFNRDKASARLDTCDQRSKTDSFKCSQCTFSTTDRKELMAHRRKHTGEKLFQCSECTAKFTRKYYLKCHLIQKHNNYSLSAGSRVHQFPRYCPYIGCNFVTRNQTSLTIHKKVHQAPRPFYCVVCPTVSYAQRRSLVQHIAKKHSSDWSLIGRDTPPVRQSKLAVAAEIKRDLMQGEAAVPEDESAVDLGSEQEHSSEPFARGPAEQKAVVCELLPGSDDSTDHYFIAGSIGDAPDSVKGARFSESTGQLANNVYRCEFCNYRSENFTSVYAHKRRKHTRRSISSRRSKRVISRKTKGAQKRPAKKTNFSCDSCSFTAARQLDLEQHQCQGSSMQTRRSTGTDDESPLRSATKPHNIQAFFSCAFCDFVTNIHESLEIHIKQRHQSPCPSRGAKTDESNSRSTSVDLSNSPKASSSRVCLGAIDSKFSSPNKVSQQSSVGFDGVLRPSFPGSDDLGDQWQAKVAQACRSLAESFSEDSFSDSGTAAGVGSEALDSTTALQECIEYLQMANSRLIKFCKAKDAKLLELRTNVRALLQVLFPKNKDFNSGSSLDRIDTSVKQIVAQTLDKTGAHATASSSNGK